MKNTNFNLFLVVFVSLVCISTLGVAPTPDGRSFSCCYVKSDVVPEVLPVVESIPVTDLAQNDRQKPPCCQVETEVEPEVLPVVESIPVTDLAQNDKDKSPCCFVETEVEPV